MKILFVNLTDYPLPPPSDVIRADTSISMSIALNLKKKGHDVHFLCPKGSTVEVTKHFSTYNPLSVIMPPEELVKTGSMLAQELNLTFFIDIYTNLIEIVKQQHFDLIHFHTNTPLSELVALSQISTPCLFTLHSVLKHNKQVYKKFFDYLNNRKNNYFVSISHTQQKTYPDLPFLDVVYNGINIYDFLFDPNGADDLLFAGRFIPEKGVKEAIMSALQTNHKLHITGQTDLIVNKEYYYSEVLPLLQKNPSQINTIDYVDKKKIYSFYGKGKATLFPIQWEEPFGLVQIESMACGTPVIAFARGSVPEVMKDGETGFVINASEKDIRGNWIIKKTGIDGIHEAIERIYSMSNNDYLSMRVRCNTYVKEFFSTEKMTQHYLKLYNQIISS